MKKQILTLVMLLGAMVSSTAQADECLDTGLYVGGFAGVNGVKGHPLGKAVRPDGVTERPSLRPGFTGGAAVGYKFDNPLRVEAEFAYRRNKIKQKLFDVDAYRNTYAGMGNVYCDLDNGSDFTPYIGGGIGYASSEVSVKKKALTASYRLKGGFAYQAMAGIDYKVADKTKVGVEYRYFHTKHLADHTAALTLKRFF